MCVRMTNSGPFDHLRDFNVVVSFHPIGSAPRLKVSKFTVHGTLTMGELHEYLVKLLPQEDVHLYVHQCVEMLPTQHVGDLTNLFGKVNETSATLNVHYSIGKAYL